MAVAPFDSGLGRLGQRSAHRRATGAGRIEPDRKFYLLVNDAPCAVIGFLCTFFNAKRALGNFADRLDQAAAKRATEARRDTSPTVGDDADVKVGSDTVGLRAINHQSGQCFVENVGNEVRFRATTAHPLFHRAGLVDDKEKASWMVAANFARIGHLPLPSCFPLLSILYGAK
jgi:hypothetical protein